MPGNANVSRGKQSTLNYALTLCQKSAQGGTHERYPADSIPLW